MAWVNTGSIDILLFYAFQLAITEHWQIFSSTSFNNLYCEYGSTHKAPPLDGELLSIKSWEETSVLFNNKPSDRIFSSKLSGLKHLEIQYDLKEISRSIFKCVNWALSGWHVHAQDGHVWRPLETSDLHSQAGQGSHHLHVNVYLWLGAWLEGRNCIPASVQHSLP